MYRWTYCRYLASVKIAARKPQKPRRILGIDPGSNVLGYAIVNQVGSHRELVTMGVHRTPARATHPEKLRSIFDCITELVITYQPAECAIESPFFGKNVQSMLKLGRAQGVAMAAAIAKGLTVAEYAPKKIKMSVTGGGNASKLQVAEMAAAMLNFQADSFPLDATDAVGAAICHLNQTAFGTSTGESYDGWKQFLERNPGRVG